MDRRSACTGAAISPAGWPAVRRVGALHLSAPPGWRGPSHTPQAMFAMAVAKRVLPISRGSASMVSRSREEAVCRDGSVGRRGIAMTGHVAAQDFLQIFSRPVCVPSQDRGERAEGRRGCQVKARRCSGTVHRSRHKACAGGPGRGAGRHEEAEAPDEAGEQHLTARGDGRPVVSSGPCWREAMHTRGRRVTLEISALRIQQRVAGRVA